MSDHKAILLKGNTSISNGDYDGFLELCTDDTIWEFVGDRILKGKQEVREYMLETYLVPPKFNITDVIESGDKLVVMGEIHLKEKNDRWVSYSYCDVWRFEQHQLAQLRAFVVPQAIPTS